jgi:N-acetylglucosamine-6-phosphate deacetylase
MTYLCDLAWTAGTLLRDQTVDVRNGTITAVRPRRPFDEGKHLHLLMPACTDLQVNGGGGVMLNSDPSPEGLRQIAAGHRKQGTAWILPTVITDTPEIMQSTVDAVLSVYPNHGILGLHIEGPHIAPERRGTHAECFIRPLDRETIDQVWRLRDRNIPVKVTLAPERSDLMLMRELIDMGTILSIGHSAATGDQTRAALGLGASCFTHLYNAMPPMTSREPGIVGTAICSEAYCGLIADGIHVSWEMARIACAGRPRNDRMFLVSDAMSTVGGPNHFELYGQTIHVKDGALVNAEGSLAGAHIDMVTSLANAHHYIGLPLERALAMATDIPRALLGLPRQSLTASPLADAITLTPDLNLTEMPDVAA